MLNVKHCFVNTLMLDNVGNLFKNSLKLDVFSAILKKWNKFTLAFTRLELNNDYFLPLCGLIHRITGIQLRVAKHQKNMTDLVLTNVGFQ